MTLMSRVAQWGKVLGLAVLALCVVVAGLLPGGSVGSVAAQPEIAPGYTTISLFNNETVWLMNSDRKAVHSWSLIHPSAGVAYLLEDGSLLVAGMVDESDWFPEAVGTGGHGYLTRYGWDSEVLWDYTLHTERQLTHHNFLSMPNGHVLAIVYDRTLRAEAEAAGRDPELFPEGRDEFWSEAIFEIDPATDEVVWEWHMWDHFVQDFDADAANYGDPAQHPELIDINYVINFPNFQEDYGVVTDWIHANSVDYNPELDQIVISARQFSELWIIDHSTTTEESASHAGGQHGRGGDLIYRWGNPAAYRAGDESDQVLWFQHDIRWVPAGLPGEGHITLFDNGSYVGRESTRILEVAIDLNADGSYNLAPGDVTPAEIVWMYEPTYDFSFIMGAAQRLPNGNTLITDGAKNRVYEVTADGEIAWRWDAETYIFRAVRYVPDYPGLSALDPDAPAISVEEGDAANAEG